MFEKLEKGAVKVPFGRIRIYPGPGKFGGFGLYIKKKKRRMKSKPLGPLAIVETKKRAGSGRRPFSPYVRGLRVQS